MPRKSSPVEVQTISSPSKMVQVNFRMPDYALGILQRLAPTRKSWGATLTQLLIAEQARREGYIEGRLEERQRLLDLYDKKNDTQN